MTTRLLVIISLSLYAWNIFAEKNICKSDCESVCRTFYIDEEGHKRLNLQQFWLCVNSCMDKKCADYSN